MGNSVIMYNRVNQRENPTNISFDDFLAYSVNNELISKIRSEADSKKRYQYKRNGLRAVSFENTNILVIDIDKVSDKEKHSEIIEEAKSIKGFFGSQETVSGNIALYFKYDRELMDKGVEFWRIYYKLWITLTAVLDIDIDYLPELNRLRYISGFPLENINTSGWVIDSYSKVETEPYVNTNGLKKTSNLERNKASISYGSGAPIQIERLLEYE